MDDGKVAWFLIWLLTGYQKISPIKSRTVDISTGKDN